MSSPETVAVAITADGTAGGMVDALATRSDFARFFGEQPADLLREIRRSASCRELGAMNRRVRAATLQHLTGTTAVEWLANLSFQADAAIVSRLLALDGTPPIGCWCFCGASGRAESLTRVSPTLAVLVGDEEDVEAAREQHGRVIRQLGECGYLPRERVFGAAFYVASVDEWKRRFRGWVSDPVIQQMYRARTLFDLAADSWTARPWNEVTAAVAGIIDRDFLHVLANDCLANVPPLTFYQDAVVDNVGERLATFQLAEGALRPLVDVARVFAMAGGTGFGRSTLERFAAASRSLPAHDQIFSEAVDTFRVVLWQQARIASARGHLVPNSLRRCSVEAIGTC
jgi:CBS domain-containing protein